MIVSIPASRCGNLSGIALLTKRFPSLLRPEGIPVNLVPGRPQLGFRIFNDTEGLCIHYARPCDAYRALGVLLSAERFEGEIVQNCVHETVSVMWDLSRNAVLRLEAIEQLFLKFSLMGINSVLLYMEDVYQLPQEPLFGYGRGAYSPEELRRIDHCGDQLGIEVIPCIQTLGHMEQVLQWPPYQALADVPGVLMVGEPGTRLLISRILDHISSCFRTRNIHIGMDEAHGMGTGAYLRKHGCRQRFDIFNEHLNLVVQLCKDRGLKPMIWSDMYFRLGSERNDYYDITSRIPPEVAAQVPAEVELVYWDYYHTDPNFYEEWIRRHREIGKEPLFAAGAWSWLCCWAYAPHWKRTIGAGMFAARRQKLSRVMLTIWGDDGSEFHPASVLPAVQYFAEWAYAGEPDDKALSLQFALISSGASLADYIRAADLDQIPDAAKREQPVNFSRWLLHHDPVFGFLNAHVSPDIPLHYQKLSQVLAYVEQDNAIRFAAKLAETVGLKAELHLHARKAAEERDIEEFRRLHEVVLPKCVEALRDLWKRHREVWHVWNKPFGWEVIERRYAGTIARLEALGEILLQAICQPDADIPEWHFTPLPVVESSGDCYFPFSRSATASVIA